MPSLWTPSSRPAPSDAPAPKRFLSELKWPDLDGSIAELVGMYGTQALDVLIAFTSASHEGREILVTAKEHPHLQGQLQTQLGRLAEELSFGGRKVGPQAEAQRILSLSEVQDSLTRVDLEQFFSRLGLEAKEVDLTHGRKSQINGKAEWAVVPPPTLRIAGMPPQWTVLKAPGNQVVQWGHNGLTAQTCSSDALDFELQRGRLRTEANQGRFWILRDGDTTNRAKIKDYLRF